MEEGAETSTLDPVPGDFIWHFHNLEDAFSVLELDISNLAYDQAVLDLEFDNKIQYCLVNGNVAYVQIKHRKTVLKIMELPHKKPPGTGSSALFPAPSPANPLRFIRR